MEMHRKRLYSVKVWGKNKVQNLRGESWKNLQAKKAVNKNTNSRKSGNWFTFCIFPVTDSHFVNQIGTQSLHVCKSNWYTKFTWYMAVTSKKCQVGSSLTNHVT